MKNVYGLIISASFIVIIFAISCNKKEPIKPNPVRRKSPTAIANIVHKPTDTYIKIVYGQPYKRGREIFGNVVPYGETWRTGANESTELTTTGDILFAGKELEAGTYSLFTIPRQNEPWTIIINSQLGQWGDFQYDPEEDVFQVEVPAVQTQTVTEAFTIRFSGLATKPTEIPIYEKDTTDIIMAWDHTKLKIPVVFLEHNSQ